MKPDRSLVNETGHLDLLATVRQNSKTQVPCRSRMRMSYLCHMKVSYRRSHAGSLSEIGCEFD